MDPSLYAVDMLQQDLDAAGVRFFKARELLRIRHPDIARDVGIATRYFTGTEDANGVDVFGELVKVARLADVLRCRYGGPLTVLNALRPTAYNSRVTKAKRSQHIYGRAMDLTCSDMPRLRAVAYDMFNAREIGGFGAYRGNIHIDTRKIPRKWGSQIPTLK